MSFLTPLYLAGLAAISLPVIFHMIRRTPKGRVPFSSVMFLDPSPPRITRRSRIEHWLLLALRALAVSLLAFAFSRPFLREVLDTDEATVEGERTVVLLDASASMRRDGLWDEARVAVLETAALAEPGDRLAVYQFGRSCDALLSFDEWVQNEASVRENILETRLDELEPGWESTQLDKALILAAEELDSLSNGDRDQVAPVKRIVLVTDLASGTTFDSLQSYDWPTDVHVEVRQVETPLPTNAGIQIVGDPSGMEPLRVRISNATESARDQFRIVWSDADGTAVAEPVQAYVPAGQARFMALPDPPNAAQVNHLALLGDDHDFDNRAFVTRTGPRDVRVHYYGNEDANDPEQLRFYLERAFPPSPRRTVSVIPALEASDDDARLTGDVPLLIATSDLPSDRAPMVRDWLKDGGTLLFVAQFEGQYPAIAGIAQAAHLEVRNASVRQYAMVTDVDFEHPVFAVFSDAHYSDFTQIHVWQHRSLDVSGLQDPRILARFDDGDPAIIESSVGKGRVLIFTLGWHPSDSELARSTKFVPLLNTILDMGSATSDVPAGFQVGDTIPVSLWNRPTGEGGAAPATVTTPADKEINIEGAGEDFDTANTPGTYTLATAEGTTRFAVNLDANESRTSALSSDHLESVGVKLAAESTLSPEEAAAVRRQLRNSELESRQKYWQWLIVAALVAILLESALAARTSRRKLA